MPKDENELDPIEAALNVGKEMFPVARGDNPDTALDPTVKAVELAQRCDQYADITTNPATADEFRQVAEDCRHYDPDRPDTGIPLQSSFGNIAKMFTSNAKMLDFVKQNSDKLGGTVENISNSELGGAAFTIVGGTLGLDEKNIQKALPGLGDMMSSAVGFSQAIGSKDVSTKDAIHQGAEGLKNFMPLALECGGSLAAKGGSFLTKTVIKKVVEYGAPVLLGAIASVVPGVGTAAGGVVGAVAGQVGGVVVDGVADLAGSAVETGIKKGTQVVGEAATNVAVDVGEKATVTMADSIKGAGHSVMDSTGVSKVSEGIEMKMGDVAEKAVNGAIGHFGPQLENEAKPMSPNK